MTMNQSELIGRVVERNEQSWIVIGESKRRFKLVNLDANAERPVATTFSNEQLLTTPIRCKGFRFKRDLGKHSRHSHGAIIFLPDGRVVDSYNYRNKPHNKLVLKEVSPKLIDTIEDIKQGKTSNRHYLSFERL